MPDRINNPFLLSSNAAGMGHESNKQFGETEVWQHTCSLVTGSGILEWV